MEQKTFFARLKELLNLLIGGGEGGGEGGKTLIQLIFRIFECTLLQRVYGPAGIYVMIQGQ